MHWVETRIDGIVSFFVRTNCFAPVVGKGSERWTVHSGAVGCVVSLLGEKNNYQETREQGKSVTPKVDNRKERTNKQEVLQEDREHVLDKGIFANVPILHIASGVRIVWSLLVVGCFHPNEKQTKRKKTTRRNEDYWRLGRAGRVAARFWSDLYLRYSPLAFICLPLVSLQMVIPWLTIDPFFVSSSTTISPSVHVSLMFASKSFHARLLCSWGSCWDEGLLVSPDNNNLQTEKGR